MFTMNTIVDTTKVIKKIANYQKVDIESEIDKIEPGPLTGKASWTKGAEILVYEPSKIKLSPQSYMMALMRQESSKFYKKAEKTTARMMENQGCAKLYKKVQAAMFFLALDMMFIEVQNTIMHTIINK